MSKDLTYRIVEALAQRGPVSQEADLPVRGLLLIGNQEAASWLGYTDNTGEDRYKLFPAIWQGERAWILRRTWWPGKGYIAEGTDETIIPFEEGCKTLIERGNFNFPMPSNDASGSV